MKLITAAAAVMVILAFTRFACAASPITDLSTLLGPKAGVLGLNDAGVMVGSQKVDGGHVDASRAMLWAARRAAEIAPWRRSAGARARRRTSTTAASSSAGPTSRATSLATPSGAGRTER